jgi:pSer/pThr/pTyr-binding forkhead associated (FHA) protein
MLTPVRTILSPAEVSELSIQLTIVNGPTRTASVRLRKTATLIGRQKGCDIRIPSDEISRRHCLLYLDKGKLTVEDLNSANGTFLNGQRIQNREMLKPGDRITVGPLVFRVDGERPKPSKPLRKVVEEPESDGEPVYRFADDKRPPAKKEIEIEFDPHAFDGIMEGDDFRDLLKGMDR